MAMMIPVGTSYPFRENEPWGLSGGLNTLRSSMVQIIMTMPGERVMRPNFGCTLRRMLFEQGGPQLPPIAAGAVRDALSKFEPRVRVLDVKAKLRNDGQALFISVQWQPVGDLESRYDLNINLPLGG